jgi:hypothetical protein
MSQLTCKLAGQPNSWDMGRIATLRQILSMLQSISAIAVGSTTDRKGFLGVPVIQPTQSVTRFWL